MAKQQIATKDYGTPLAVVFNFSDDESVTVSKDDFPAEIQDRLMQYGIAQKFGDEYAGAEGPQEAREALLALIERMKVGDWKQARGTGTARVTMLAEALAQVTGKDIEECQEKIADMDDETTKNLRKHPQVAAALATIKAQRAAEAAKKAQAEAATGDVQALQF